MHPRSGAAGSDPCGMCQQSPKWSNDGVASSTSRSLAAVFLDQTLCARRSRSTHRARGGWSGDRPKSTCEDVDFTCARWCRERLDSSVGKWARSTWEDRVPGSRASRLGRRTASHNREDGKRSDSSFGHGRSAWWRSQAPMVHDGMPIRQFAAGWLVSWLAGGRGLDTLARPLSSPSRDWHLSGRAIRGRVCRAGRRAIKRTHAVVPRSSVYRRKPGARAARGTDRRRHEAATVWFR
ncbi:hypothetical protein C8Q76DRAFT_3087 [Earliella scabrosa]|nr:hypothetical protein C8Q76DRAFT_3087 [Earliella scabrosa]